MSYKITPSEKAKDLVDKFNTIEYALKCVDEILNAYLFGGASSTYDINFWDSVRLEIEKMNKEQELERSVATKLNQGTKAD